VLPTHPLLRLQSLVGNAAVAAAVIQRQAAATVEAKTGEAKAVVEPTVTFSSQADKSTVSDYALGVLKDVMKAAGEKSATISSTIRNAADQARVMYNNLEGTGEKQGVEAQRKLYGAAGDQVIDVYEKLKGEKKTPDEIKLGMKEKIDEVGPSNVSNHCGDHTKLIVFDVGPASISDDDKFAEAAEAEPRVKKYISYKTDPGHHFEIEPK
jgi:hypothetical protein